MKVRYNKCKDSNTEDGWLTDGKEYIVLTIKYLQEEGITYGIESDSSIAATVHFAKLFDQTSKIIPSNWCLDILNSSLQILPIRWNNSEFWEKYHNGEKEGCKLFEKEKEKILFKEFYYSLNSFERAALTAELREYPSFSCRECKNVMKDTTNEMLLICSNCGYRHYNPRFNSQENKLTVKLKEKVKNSAFLREKKYSVDSIVVSEIKGAFFTFENYGNELFSIEKFDVVDPYIPNDWKILYNDGLLKFRRSF